MVGWRYFHTRQYRILHCGKCDCQSGNRPFAEHDIPDSLLATGKKDASDPSEGKEQQYNFGQENVDLINQKYHDLKQRIRALKLVRGRKRSAIQRDRRSSTVLLMPLKTGS